MYPLLHPHQGHSQLDIRNLSDSPTHDQSSLVIDNTNGLVVWEGILNAGDVLYVPPFWLHHVETLSDSISVNIWSDSKAYFTLDTIYRQAVPFEAEWTFEQLLHACRYYLTSLREHLDWDSSSHPDDDAMPDSNEVLREIRYFMTELQTQRYEPLVKQGLLDVDKKAMLSVKKICQIRPLSSIYPSPAQIFHNQDDSGVEASETIAVIEGFKNRVTQAIDKLVVLFEQIEDEDLRRSMAKSYTERLLNGVLSVQHVYPVLTFCF